MTAMLTEAIGLLGSGKATEVELEIDGMILLVRRLSHRRSAITDHRLSAVASRFKSGGVEAVENELAISQSQAYRLIRLARDAGLITSPKVKPVQRRRLRL